MPKILITGFAPFGGESINPSWQIAKSLPKTIARHQIECLEVPTEFGRAIKVTTKAIDSLKPVIVLCLGQAGGRARLSVERVAINMNDARIADNAGQQPIDESIAPLGEGAPAAYFATLPIKAMVEAMTMQSIPAEVSNTAGTFVCNHLLYGVLHHIATKKLSIRSGFMHVPFLPSQTLDRADTASMSLDTMIEGVKVAIMAAITNQTDIKRVGGALD
jgi:pyroglutamyl-peptidase